MPGGQLADYVCYSVLTREAFFTVLVLTRPAICRGFNAQEAFGSTSAVNSKRSTLDGHMQVPQLALSWKGQGARLHNNLSSHHAPMVKQLPGFSKQNAAPYSPRQVKPMRSPQGQGTTPVQHNAPCSSRPPAGHAVLPHLEHVIQSAQGPSRKTWLHSPVRPLESGCKESMGRRTRRVHSRVSSSGFYSHQSPFSSDDGMDTGPSTSSQARDGGMFGMLQSCYNFGCNATATIVAWAADVFLASPIAPFNVDRAAVENSIRTALVLAGLTLLQRAIPVLVNLGCIGLGVYVLTHVYNVKVPVPGESRDRARRRPPGGRHSTVADVTGATGATQRSGTASKGSTSQAAGSAPGA
eukprot:scaffold252845_cov22-Tisochrysis_lutea.AAC.1